MPYGIGAGIEAVHRELFVPQFRPAPITVPPVGRGLIVIV
jgi:hypothetical protein